MTSRARAISLGLEVLASDPAVRDIWFRGVLLSNLVPTRGYASLEAVKAEGEVQGLQSAIVEILPPAAPVPPKLRHLQGRGLPAQSARSDGVESRQLNRPRDHGAVCSLETCGAR